MIIQTKFWYSDRELIDQIIENPYLQLFIGISGFQEETPFDARTLVLFRKHISAEMIIETNTNIYGFNLMTIIMKYLQVIT